MMRFIDYICAILVRSLNHIFHFIPIEISLWLGRRMGTLFYHLNRDRKTIGYANLRAAFSKEKTPAQLKKLIKSVFRDFAQTFFEILSLTKVNKKYIDKYVEIVNEKSGRMVVNSHRGVLFLTAHFGNWELSGMVCALNGFPITVLAREQSMKKLNELLNRLRESKGLHVVTKGITVKYIVKALHEGKIIGMVGDQDAGKTGVYTEFFGRLASTAAGTARLAQKTGAYILPAFMARIRGPYHKAILAEPIEIGKKEDLEPYIAKYNKLLEKYVRMYPEQWLWLHKRWKSTPLKRVVILSDGKAGHLNQAKAFCKQLLRYREHSGYKPEDTQVKIIETRFKNTFTKNLFRICNIFSNNSCQGCMKCLKFSLTQDSYEALMCEHADIVISCGSSVAAINKLFSIENNAKSACVMKPPFLGFKKFDMLVMPKHDGKSSPDGRVIATDLSPNLIDDDILRESSKEILSVTRPEKDAKIGVLLGGDNSDFSLTSDAAETLLENVIDASNKMDADILLTTSRRTSPDIEKIVKNKLDTEKRCKFLVLANKKNTPHAVSGILGLADVIVVSGESASMVSEAITSGKRVIVFKLKKKKIGRSKFDKMLAHLSKKGYVTISETEKLSDAICATFRKAEPINLPQDHFNIYKYMWRLGV